MPFQEGAEIEKYGWQSLCKSVLDYELLHFGIGGTIYFHGNLWQHISGQTTSRPHTEFFTPNGSPIGREMGTHYLREI